MYDLLKEDRDRHVFKELLKKIYLGQCVPFTGAGVSKEAEVGIPDVQGLVALLANECAGMDHSVDVYRVKDEPLKMVAAKYLIIHSRFGTASPRLELAGFLSRHLTPKSIDIPSGKSSFPFIVNIPWKKDKKSIVVTTNWDSLIEDAVRKYTSEQYRVIAKKEHSTFIGIEDSIKIVKLHGTLDDENSIIITEDDYLDAMAGKHAQALFQWLATTLLVETVVFVGYSLSDPNILFLYEELRKISGLHKFDHYIVNGENPNENDIKRWSERGVKFLPLKARDFFRLVYIETNKFINRDEQRALEKIGSFRYFSILGNAGFGKTTLLQRIHDDLFYKGSPKFNFFHYESYSRTASTNPALTFLKFLENFALKLGIALKEIPKEDIIDEARVKVYLSGAIATVRNEIRRPTLLLFDCTSHLD